MTQLLVSVRSAAEAETALRGGAALIDVKEPAHGSLGRASDTVIAEVVRTVAGVRPVSAALGELSEALELPSEPLAYVKWGLASLGRCWQEPLRDGLRRLTEQRLSCRAVASAYADWRRAAAPPPAEVCSFAVANKMGAFLLDTWAKDGSTLLHWLPLDAVARLAECCRTAGLPIALAGSLGEAEIERLLPLRPDWIAVRGAVCQGRHRTAEVEETRVRRLVGLLRAVDASFG